MPANSRWDLIRRLRVNETNSVARSWPIHSEGVVPFDKYESVLEAEKRHGRW